MLNLLLSFLLFLSACSHLSSPSSYEATQTLTTRPYHQHIEMAGRLSAQYEQNNRPQAIHIHFNWVQTPQQIKVTLTSPTGQTLATLLVNAQGAQLNQPNRLPQFADDANQLLSNMLGWPLPIAGLRDWLQGFVNTDTGPVTGLVAITSQSAKDSYFLVDGWNLSYPAWVAENTENARPKRLDLTRQTQQAGLVSLRLVIDQWDTP